MSQKSAAIPESATTNLGIPNGKLGMWVFLASEVMFFTGLIGGYIVLRLGSASWPNPHEILAVPVLGFNTFVLICSSVTMVLALQSAEEGQRKKQIGFLAATIALGSTFLIIKLVDYGHMIHEGFTIKSSLFGTCYYTLTGFHGLHVFAGIVTLLVLLIGSVRGRITVKNASLLENVGLYWHFVDLVWIILFAILCLV